MVFVKSEERIKMANRLIFIEIVEQLFNYGATKYAGMNNNLNTIEQ